VIDVLVQVLAWLLVLLVALRVEHLWASALWVLRRGRFFRDKLLRLGHKKRIRPRRIAEIFSQTDGGKLPFLFVGVKSYRIEIAALNQRSVGHRWRALLLGFARAGWRFYTFPFLILPITFGASLSDTGSSVRVQLLAVSLLLCLGFMAIGAESFWAKHRMGSWITYYHRFPKPPGKDDQPDTAMEGMARVGVLVLMVIPCVCASILVAGAFFDAYQGYPDGAGARIRYAIDTCIGYVDLSGEPSANTAALVTKVASMLVLASFVIIAISQAIGDAVSRPERV
jgi:hypothetical protein